MSLLQAHELAFRYADFLFQKTSFELSPGDRVGLVGPNGAGKTTLLRLLAGELEADAGTLARRRGLRVAYLRQDVAAAPGRSVSAWLAAADTPDLERDLYGLGFASADLHLPLAALSAGQRSRAHLARCLSAGPDLLLLDEPTNHLDLAAREWLTARLLEFEGAAVVVSHDRRLLETVTNRTFEIRRGEFRSYGGGYAWYERERSRLSAQHWAQYEEQQGRLAAFDRAAERRARLARRVAEAPDGIRGGKDFYARKSAKVARTGRLLREREFHEPKVEKPWQEDPIPVLDFSRVARAAAVPVELESVCKCYEGKPVLSDLSLRVRRGERWAVRGPNGCGKTTLFRLLLGLEQPDSGRIAIGPNAQFGYYAQEAENLDSQRTPVEVCCEEGADATWVRTLLACLKLPRDLAEQPVGLLSLGERAKVALTRVLVSQANVLLLDEPTNHLEIEAQEALEDTLRQFPGTILLVSHDARFTENVADHFLDLGTPRAGRRGGPYTEGTA